MASTAAELSQKARLATLQSLPTWAQNKIASSPSLAHAIDLSANRLEALLVGEYKRVADYDRQITHTYEDLGRKERVLHREFDVRLRWSRKLALEPDRTTEQITQDLMASFAPLAMPTWMQKLKDCAEVLHISLPNYDRISTD